jgi:phosphoribosyl 1,2-cyclic phosphate phosphodiesterase
MAMTTTDTLRVTLLGSGSSAGVPRIGGDWGACDPREPKNRRTRGGLLVQRWRGPASDPAAATTVLVDTSPDLREQLLAAEVKRIDAVLYSHDHADQTHGIDDLRAFFITHRRRVRVWMDDPTRDTLMRRFGYCFRGEGLYPAVLDDAGSLEPGEPVRIDGPGGPIEALPLAQDHGTTTSLGFRFGPVAYSNDVVMIADETFSALGGLDLWFVDALRYRPHPTHAHVERALEWVERLKPRHAVLVNMHIDLDYAQLKAELPGGVEPGYDGWRADFAVQPDG